MRTIGMIGGLAWPSTALYYTRINELISQRLGGFHCAKMILIQTDLDEIHHLQEQNHWDKIGIILSQLAERLEAAGADFLLIISTSIHVAIPQILATTNLPMLHVSELLAVRMKKEGYRKVGLLPSYIVQAHRFFVQHLREHFNITVVLPEEKDIQRLKEIHEAELVRGLITLESKKVYVEIVQTLVDMRAELVVLGMTEYGMLVKQEDVEIPLLDVVTVHTEAAVEAALADER